MESKETSTLRTPTTCWAATKTSFCHYAAPSSAGRPYLCSSHHRTIACVVQCSVGNPGNLISTLASSDVCATCPRKALKEPTILLLSILYGAAGTGLCHPTGAEKPVSESLKPVAMVLTSPHS